MAAAGGWNVGQGHQQNPVLVPMMDEAEVYVTRMIIDEQRTPQTARFILGMSVKYLEPFDPKIPIGPSFPGSCKVYLVR